MVKKALILLAIALPTLSQAGTRTHTASFSWSGITRNEAGIYQAAFAAACPTGSQYTNVRLFSYSIDRSETQKKLTGQRSWKGWGTAVCAFDVDQELSSNGQEELPDLNGTGAPAGPSTGGMAVPDDSDQLGNG